MVYNTIKLCAHSKCMKEQVLLAGPALPGMLVQIYSADGDVRKHTPTSGTVFRPMFLVEDELQGKGISDEFASGDRVQVWVPYPGDEVYALLADGENVARGDKLASNGDGYLKKHDADSLHEDEIVAIAMEAVNLSSSSGGDTNTTGRIRVMV